MEKNVNVDSLAKICANLSVELGELIEKKCQHLDHAGSLAVFQGTLMILTEACFETLKEMLTNGSYLLQKENYLDRLIKKLP